LFDTTYPKFRVTTQNDSLGSSIRKKYLLKKHSMQEGQLASQSKNNIFSLGNESSSSGSLEMSHTMPQSMEDKALETTLFASSIKDILAEQPSTKLTTLNFTTTGSNFYFIPTVALPKVVRKPFHPSDPLYVQQAATRDHRNITRFRKCQHLWLRHAQLRKNKSLQERSA
jgi:hypothetical protein